jgi:DNA repair protein RadC
MATPRTQARSENPKPYLATKGGSPSQSDDDAITHALAILAERLTLSGPIMESPLAVKAYCRLKLGGLGHEEFGVLFLSTQHQLICFESIFRGTLSQTSVYPREVVKLALQYNAAAVILTHNHPSGSVEPSRADQHLTMTLKSALALVDVRVLDHVVVSAGDALSFAERGLL